MLSDYSVSPEVFLPFIAIFFNFLGLHFLRLLDRIGGGGDAISHREAAALRLDAGPRSGGAVARRAMSTLLK